ncbi:MAG: hypothetical protein H7Z17_17270 [Fuerstia sp.]|nr:hypothetical protein [Fuerstiella sp.]
MDSDIGFDPDDVERLRSHQLPVVAGLYARKGQRQFACKFLPETRQVRLGLSGRFPCAVARLPIRSQRGVFTVCCAV